MKKADPIVLGPAGGGKGVCSDRLAGQDGGGAQGLACRLMLQGAASLVDEDGHNVDVPLEAFAGLLGGGSSGR